MRLWSESFENRRPIPAQFAMGQAGGFGANQNPHLAWDEVPPAASSFVLICVDPDAPTQPETVGRKDLEIPVDQPRGDFIHWVMADIGATVRSIAAASCSDGVTAQGKRLPRGPSGTRQGLNDFTGWFAGDTAMGGDYFGYDGPYPPFNDLRVHRYFFRLFALDVEKLPLAERFTAADALRAMQGHVLAEALVQGTYSLHVAD